MDYTRGIKRSGNYVSGEALLASDTLQGAACLIVDVQLPEMNGFELRARLATMTVLPPVMFITAFDSPEARAQALEAGAVAFLTKPLTESLRIPTFASTSDDFAILRVVSSPSISTPIPDPPGWERRNLERFCVHQAYYSLVCRDLEHELIPLSLDQQVGITVFSPLAGLLL